MDLFDLDFHGLQRKLPLTYIASNKQIATFTIVGDVEFTEVAGALIESELKKRNIIPDCFVGPGTNILCFVHHMAKRFGHAHYVILRKSILNYMTSPEVQLPWRNAPKHAKKLVINGSDSTYLKGKKVVLIDDVVSTGTTMEMQSQMMEKIGATVLAKCSIFKQGDRCTDKELIYLDNLPIFIVTRDGQKTLLTEEQYEM
jgi:adenine phosphoribosyltransferase